MDYYKESLKMHEEHKGKMAVASKVKVETKDDLVHGVHTGGSRAVPQDTRKILKTYINTRTSPISWL